MPTNTALTDRRWRLLVRFMLVLWQGLSHYAKETDPTLYEELCKELPKGIIYMSTVDKDSVLSYNGFMKINRYSAKCKLCKARWTTEESDRTKAFNAHEPNCPKYARYLAVRVGSQAENPRRVESERYQMSVLWFYHIQIEGHFVAEKVCDGRCMGATGHICDCSCGGANHGKAAAA